MKLVFLETPLFTRIIDKYLSDESYRALQCALMQNPELGDVMAGTGGFCKARWEDTRRGKGKRGGLRIIYYYLTSDHQIWFFTLYSKNGVNPDLANDLACLATNAAQLIQTGFRGQGGTQALAPSSP